MESFNTTIAKDSADVSGLPFFLDVGSPNLNSGNSIVADNTVPFVPDGNVAGGTAITLGSNHIGIDEGLGTVPITGD